MCVTHSHHRCQLSVAQFLSHRTTFISQVTSHNHPTIKCGVLVMCVLVLTVFLLFVLCFCIVCTVFCIVCTVFLYCLYCVLNCLYCVLYCLYCVFFCFLCIFILICFVCTSVRTTATELQLDCINNNNNNNNNKFNIQYILETPVPRHAGPLPVPHGSVSTQTATADRNTVQHRKARPLKKSCHFSLEKAEVLLLVYTLTAKYHTVDQTPPHTTYTFCHGSAKLVDKAGNSEVICWQHVAMKT